MFKKTVNLSRFKQQAPELLDSLKEEGDSEAIQLVHRGGSIYVVLTQERYLGLLDEIDRLRRHQDLPKGGGPDVARIRAALKEMESLLKEDEEHNAPGERAAGR